MSFPRPWSSCSDCSVADPFEDETFEIQSAGKQPAIPTKSPHSLPFLHYLSNPTRILASHSTLPNVPVTALHEALFASAGSPLWLRVVVLVLAALPFAIAALVVR